MKHKGLLVLGTILFLAIFTVPWKSYGMVIVGGGEWGCYISLLGETQKDATEVQNAAKQAVKDEKDKIPPAGVAGGRGVAIAQKDWLSLQNAIKNGVQDTFNMKGIIDEVEFEFEQGGQPRLNNWINNIKLAAELEGNTIGQDVINFVRGKKVTKDIDSVLDSTQVLLGETNLGAYSTITDKKAVLTGLNAIGAITTMKSADGALLVSSARRGKDQLEMKYFPDTYVIENYVKKGKVDEFKQLAANLKQQRMVAVIVITTGDNAKLIKAANIQEEEDKIYFDQPTEGSLSYNVYQAIIAGTKGQPFTVEDMFKNDKALLAVQETI